MEPEYFTPNEFMTYDSETGEWKFLNGKVVHDGIEVFIRKVTEVDIRESFKPNPPVEKPPKCSIPDCNNPPCQSFLSNSHCPRHYALTARDLLIPDTPEKCLVRPLLGCKVIVRLSPKKKHTKRSPLLQTWIIKFREGKLYISIDKTDQLVNDWRYYSEKGQAIFEIFDTMHYDKSILTGDYKAHLLGQPICKNLLKGRTCKSTTDFDPPYQDSLPELIASSILPKTYGFPGVFPKRDNKDQLTMGKKCVRCAREKPEPQKEEKPAAVKVTKATKIAVAHEPKHLSKEDMTDRLIHSLQQQLELMKKLQEQKDELAKQLTNELAQTKRELSKAIAAKSDLEERLRKTN